MEFKVHFYSSLRLAVFQGLMYKVGDVVGIDDEEDGKTYFAQVSAVFLSLLLSSSLLFLSFYLCLPLSFITFFFLSFQLLFVLVQHFFSYFYSSDTSTHDGLFWTQLFRVNMVGFSFCSVICIFSPFFLFVLSFSFFHQ